MIYGLDISNWQAGFPLGSAASQLDFVILKASEYGWKNGHGGKDQQFDTFAATAVSKGLKLGAYMFARDTSYGSVSSQVDLFIRSVGKYLDRYLLVLDWEDTSYSKVQGKTSLCLQFLDEIKRRSGKIPLLYTSQSEVRYNNYSAIKNAGYPLWGACYLNANANHSGFISDPKLPAGGWGAYGPRPLIYQYTSTGRLSGWQLDMNAAYMSKSDWDKLAGGSSPQPSGKIDEDGWIGPESVRAMQSLLGSPYVDGVISGQYKPNRSAYPAITDAALEFDGGSGESWLVKKIQAKLGVEADGILGKTTIKAWQKRLRDKGYSSIIDAAGGADGILGNATARCIQKSVNAKSMF